MYIGQGLSVNEAIEKVGMVVEGINALDAAYKLSKIYNVELPIINCVYDVVKNNIKPIDSVKKLYERDLKSETFHIEQ
jgi:glycerol-3-phosphate dehydrogenase